MQIETWEEACKYIWKDTFGITIELIVEEGAVYFTLEEGTEKHYWCRVGNYSPSYLLKRWEIIGNNPNYIPPLTIQEKVCKKIISMEQRFQRYQQRKQHGE